MPGIGGPSPAVSALASLVNLGNVSGTVLLDLSAAHAFTATVTGDVIFQFTHWPSAGLCRPVVAARQDGTGGHSIALDNVTWQPAGQVPVWDVTALATNLIEVVSLDGGATIFADAVVPGPSLATLGALGAGSTVRHHYRPGLYYTLPFSAAPTTTALTAGQLRLFPFAVDETLLIERLSAIVTTVGSGGGGSAGTNNNGRFRIGIYADDGDMYPGALVFDSGALGLYIDGGVASAQEIETAILLPPGDYWLGGVTQSAPATPPTVATSGTGAVPVCGYTTLPTSAQYAGGYYASSVTGALPSTFPAIASASTAQQVPRISIKAAS